MFNKLFKRVKSNTVITTNTMTTNIKFQQLSTEKWRQINSKIDTVAVVKVYGDYQLTPVATEDGERYYIVTSQNDGKMFFAEWDLYNGIFDDIVYDRDEQKYEEDCRKVLYKALGK